jgi:pyridoxal 5'-phosphate synthase pdxS subunit
MDWMTRLEGISMARTGTDVVKRGMAEMQKGGVIMDVVTAEQAKIAEAAGAVAVMALERVPSDIRAAGGVARMADPTIVEDVMKAVSIPVMAKCRIGHIVEARLLESMGVDYIDESEVLTPADDKYHINKKTFTVPFVCGARDLGEALRRIVEGASMIRTKGEPGTGNIIEAVKHQRTMQAQIRRIQSMSEDELVAEAKSLGAPFEILLEVHQSGKLPVVNFAAGGVATPADAALMMELGSDGVFVGSGIFKSDNPEKYGRAVVEATTHYQDYERIVALSKGLGAPMKGIDLNTLRDDERMANRGW